MSFPKPSSLISADQRLDLYSAEPIAMIGRARGHALIIGTLIIQNVTATDEAELSEIAAELKRFKAMFAECVDAVLGAKAGLFKSDIAMREREIVKTFALAVSHLPEDGSSMDREAAVALATTARRDVLPAIYRIIEALQSADIEATEVRLAAMMEKAELVDRMMSEMTRIGRMIGLISINASVEAARAGGESGRAFRVIAEEVQSLANQSSDLMRRTRQNLAETQMEAAHQAMRNVG